MRIWRNAARQSLEQWPPEEAVVDVIVENASGVDDVGQLGRTLLGLGDFRLDFFPVRCDVTQPGLDLNRAIGIPGVIKKEDCSTTREHEHPDLERVALALALLENFFVQKIEL